VAVVEVEQAVQVHLEIILMLATVALVQTLTTQLLSLRG
jgi:hypothetical protein